MGQKVYNINMTSIFKPEIAQAFGFNLTEDAVKELETVLRDECKATGVPYTRNYLKAIVATIRRFVILGTGQTNMVKFNGPQVMYALGVERLLERFEQKVAEGMKDIKSVDEI